VKNNNYNQLKGTIMKKLLILLGAMALIFTLATAEGKCGEGKCGEGAKTEKKSDNGKCSGDKKSQKCSGDKKDMKCEAGKCNGEKKATPKKCG